MLVFPFSQDDILRKKRAIKRQLLARPNLLKKKIAILGGSTTSELRDSLEIFLLNEGIQPEFYESDYNRFYEDAVFGSPVLDSFQPDLILVFTSSVNVTRWPEMNHSPEEVDVLAEEEICRFRAVWDALAARFPCPLVQNNFDPPFFRTLGNADFTDHRGRVRFVNMLNERIGAEARGRKGLYVHDLNYQASCYGLSRWADRGAWHSYKLAFASEAMPVVAHSISAMVKAIWGRAKKCLVLDLDNTLWGGVIGDDGVNGIRIGKETAEAEAYTEFQRYLKGLAARGVLLAVCSKNDRANALSGLAHPDSILKEEDFTAIMANWDPKHLNIEEVAKAVNIGLDSLVFVDDNPAEREIVRAQLPDVSVPEIASQVEQYLPILEGAGYFESVAISEEDLSRAQTYKENSQRESQRARFRNYGEFLDSLKMKAEIAPFSQLYLDRIHQLTNKTNQFNLTTRRYSREEMEQVLGNKNHIAFYGRLYDRFGDNGLISVVDAEVRGEEAEIRLWLMSCRVLKRGMEHAMMDALVAECARRGVRRIVGKYLKTPKNQMVENLLGDLGFQLQSKSDVGDSVWHFEAFRNYKNQNIHIQVGGDESANVPASTRNIS